MTDFFHNPTRWIQVGAVVLVLLLPLTALTTHPGNYSWSDLDPNLVQVRTAPGSVTFNGTGAELHASSVAASSFLNFASLSATTNAAFGAFFEPQGRFNAFLAVGYFSPYNGSAAFIVVAGATGLTSLEIFNASGLADFYQGVGSITPTEPFQVDTSFVPPQTVSFEVVQGATVLRGQLEDRTLVGTVPANLATQLTTTGGPAELTISSAEITVPTIGNTVYSASSIALDVQYGAAVALALVGFRAELARALRGAFDALRRALAELRSASALTVGLVTVGALALPVQLFLVVWGSQPYDLFTQELWSYLGVHSGVVSMYSISQLVPGGKCCETASFLGSGDPYPPLASYLLLAAGGLARLLPGTATLPSPNLGYLIKCVWLIFLDATGLVVALELRRAHVREGWAVLAFAAVALNPGLLFGSVLWGTFDIVLAFFLLLFAVSIRREAWTVGWFFLLLAVLTKQDALLFLPLAIPIVVVRAGLARAVWSGAKALVASFFVLLPLLVAGLSPAFVVNSAAGTNVFNAVSTAPSGVAPWELIVSNGDYNIWPLVTWLRDGQHGLFRLQYPDYLPNQALGLPYVDVGLLLAGLGVLILWLVLWRRARSTGLGYEWPLLLLISFLWSYEVLTRLSARYLALAIPLSMVLWTTAQTRRVGVLITTGLTAVCALSLTATLSTTAFDTHAAGMASLGAAVHAFVTNDFITGLSVAQLVVVAGVGAVVAALCVTDRIPGSIDPLPSRARLPSLGSAPRVSVVVLNYNGGDMGRACVASVLASDYPHLEVIVVDNASRDDSIERMSDLERSGRIRVVRNPTNEGYSRGNNRGATFATGDLLLFLNNDTVVDPTAVGRMVEHFRSRPDTGAAQPLILSMDDRRVSNAGNELDVLGFRSSVGEGAPAETTSVRPTTGYAQGAALMIRAPLFQLVGGFDALLAFYYTDVDLSWKVWLAGFEVTVVPGARVYHAEGTSGSASDLSARLSLMVTGQLLVVAKNYSTLDAATAVVSLGVTDAALCLLLWAIGRGSESRAVLRGIGGFLDRLAPLRTGRGSVRRFRTVTDAQTRERFLRPFNPLAVLAAKRGGYGYVADRPRSRF